MVNLRQIEVGDIEEIQKIFYEYTGRELCGDICDWIRGYPSVVAENERGIVGFCYGKSFSPDMLELLNIFVVPEHRGKGIGLYLLQNFEIQAIDCFEAVILVNSILYKSKEDKRFAKKFYLDNGYDLLLSTKGSNIYGKNIEGYLR